MGEFLLHRLRGQRWLGEAIAMNRVSALTQAAQSALTTVAGQQQIVPAGFSLIFFG